MIMFIVPHERSKRKHRVPGMFLSIPRGNKMFVMQNESVRFFISWLFAGFMLDDIVQHRRDSWSCEGYNASVF